MDAMKAGVTTTEFWVTILGNVAGILVATGVLQPQEGTEITKSVSAIVGGVISLITILKYISTRTDLKAQAMDNQARVQMASIQASKG